MMKKLIFIIGALGVFLSCEAQVIRGNIGVTGTFTVNAINEYSNGLGLTLESVLIEDGRVEFTGTSQGVFWGTNTGIYEPIGDNLTFYITGEDRMVMTSSTFAPSTTGGMSFGSALKWILAGYFTTGYFGNSSVSIDYNSGTGEMRLTDAINGANDLSDLVGGVTTLSAGTVTATTYGITSDGGVDDLVLPEATTSLAGLLGADKWDEIVANTDKVTNATHTGDVTGATALTIAEGAVDIAMLSATGTPSDETYLRGDNTWNTPSGGFDPGDTIAATDIVRLMEDTCFLFGWDVPDSSWFHSSTQVAAFYHYGPDTMYITQARVGVENGSAANFTYNLQFAPGRDDSPTTLFTSAKQVEGAEVDDIGEIDTAENPSIPPGNWCWLTIEAYTTKPPRGASFNFIGYEY